MMSEIDYKKKYHETITNLDDVLSTIDFSGKTPIVVDSVSLKSIIDKMLANAEKNASNAVQGHP